MTPGSPADNRGIRELQDMTKAVRIRAPRTRPKHQFRMEEGYGNA